MKKYLAMHEIYNLKKSREVFGELDEVWMDEDGEIIDGFHRKEVNPNWKEKRIEGVSKKTTPLKYYALQWERNNARRITDDEEKRRIINVMAEELLQQGFKQGRIANEIWKRISASQTTIRLYLDDKYNMKSLARHKPKSATEPLPITIIEESKNILGQKRFELLKKALRKRAVRKPKAKGIQVSLKDEQISDFVCYHCTGRVKVFCDGKGKHYIK